MHLRIEFEPRQVDEVSMDGKELVEFRTAGLDCEFSLERINNELFVHVPGHGGPYKLKSVKFLTDMRRAYFDLERNPQLSRIAANLSSVERIDDLASQLEKLLKHSSASWFHRTRD